MVPLLVAIAFFSTPTLLTSNPHSLTTGYIVLLVAVALLAHVGILPPELLGVDAHATVRQLQLWRLLTPFLYVDGIGSGFALQLWFFSVYSNLFERRHFPRAAAKYAGMLSVGAGLILLQVRFAVRAEPPTLAHALCLFVVTLWARAEPHKRVLLFSAFTVRAGAVPWIMLASCLPITGVLSALANVGGIAAALMVEGVIGLPAVADPKAATERERSAGYVQPAASGGGGGGSRGGGKVGKAGGNGGKGGGGKASAKGALASRERWMRYAQAAGAVLLVACQGAGRVADSRAEQRAEATMCRQLRQAMETSGPLVSRLVAKFAESKPLTADAATIFAMWSFATEHWAQAQQQQTAAVNVNNLTDRDAETLRQLVAQALARSDLPDELSDEELVPEVYQLLGMNRLLPTADATAAFAAAIGAFRAHRSRTAAAWSFIKHLVFHGDQPEQRQLNQSEEIYSTVNASLAEYDLPSHMSDHAVLSELFGLLELPRDAVSFRVEGMLLAAIREHRRERSMGAAAALSSHIAKLRAVLRNDSDAVDTDGGTLLAYHEVATLEAANDTVHAVLAECFSWMELPTEADDVDGWTRLLSLLNMTEAETDATFVRVDGTPTLRAAYDELRHRRAADAHAQRTFDDLIATVKAEDPALAAEEARRAAVQRQYEENRIGWLQKLIARAEQRAAGDEGGTLPAQAAAATATTMGAAASTTTATSVATATATSTATEPERETTAETTAAGAGGEMHVGGGANGGFPLSAIEVAEVDSWGVDWATANTSAWREELAELQRAHEERARLSSALSPQELREEQKHEHYGRLQKLPRLIDETLSTWIDPSEDLSDKQIFQELLRLMGLGDSVEPRLMRTMIEAVKQHRLRREKLEAAKADWASRGPEPLALRPSMRAPFASLLSSDALVNVGCDGNDFAVFVAALLSAIGAHVRVSLGCSSNLTAASSGVDAPRWETPHLGAAVADTGADADADAADGSAICQLFTEVRLGKHPSKIVGWVRSRLPASKWLGHSYLHRLDAAGYVWLNLDWIDGHRVQRPGAPYKPFELLTTFYPSTLTWEREGEEFDSAGEPRLPNSPVQALQLGVR